MKAMMIKDIMLGDWVYILNFPEVGKKTPVKIVGIDTNHNAVEYVHNDIRLWSAVVRLEPIPMTPEILEKNGWKNISDHTLKGCETFRLHIEQRSFDYTLTLKMRDYFRLDSYDDRVYTLCEVNFGFKYVHQLQNALRLCGIKKEITI